MRDLTYRLAAARPLGYLLRRDRASAAKKTARSRRKISGRPATRQTCQWQYGSAIPTHRCSRAATRSFLQCSLIKRWQQCRNRTPTKRN